MRVFFICIIWLLCIFQASTQDTASITIHNAGQYIGREATICEHVSDIYKPSGDNKMIYINFGGKYPDQIFTSVIFPKDQPKFSYNPVEVLKDKNVCITGKISEYKGKAQMVLYAPSQLVIKN